MYDETKTENDPEECDDQPEECDWIRIFSSDSANCPSTATGWKPTEDAVKEKYVDAAAEIEVSCSNST